MPVKWSPKARGGQTSGAGGQKPTSPQIVLKAKGEVARFNELLPQYPGPRPSWTRDRIYLETMEELYQQANKVVVDMPAGNNSMIYLPLDKLSGRRMPCSQHVCRHPGSRGGPAVQQGPTPLRPAAWR